MRPVISRRRTTLCSHELMGKLYWLTPENSLWNPREVFKGSHHLCVAQSSSDIKSQMSPGQGLSGDYEGASPHRFDR